MWHSRIFWRLFGLFGALFAATLTFLGWLLVGRVEARLLEQIQLDLKVKTALVSELTKTEDVAGPKIHERVRQLAMESDTRITLIAADGIVLSDSAERAETMDNHGGRPEVREAETNGIGFALRFSDTVHQNMINVARRVDSGPIRYVRVGVTLATVEAEARVLRRLIWTAVGIVLLLVLALSWIVARRLSIPLVNLADAARTMSCGTYGERVLIATKDEIGTLATAFNDMTAACAASISQMDQDRQQLRAILRSMVEGVMVVSADHHIQFLNDAAGNLLRLPSASVEGMKLWQLFRHRQLGEAVERVLAADEPYRCEVDWPGEERRFLSIQGTRLPGSPSPGAVLVLHDITEIRRLERVRQDFVANASHELKTPLAAIQATVETLLDGAINDPEHNVRFLTNLRDSAERLGELVRDLLSLGRIESGEEVMDLQPLSLQSAVAACLQRHGPRALVKKLSLNEVAQSTPVTVLADEDALAEILDNLVDNAVKYTPQGGNVTVRWRAEDAEAILEVEDTGVGIPDHELPRIFERFYRVDKARSRALGGTGLGLSIVKHLVQVLGGSITTSSRVGEGTIFTVRLPLVSEPAATPTKSA